MAERKPYRLPTSVTPLRYQIRLTPDLTTWTFAGEESVLVEVHEPVDKIIVNGAELEFGSVTVTGADGKRLRANVALDGENEQAIFTFPGNTARRQLRFADEYFPVF